MHFVKKIEPNKIILDLFGGTQIYYIDSKKYVIVRDCGMFSNITVAIFGIFILTINGYDIDDVEITMTDYFLDRNVYPILFKKQNMELSFNFLSENDIDFFIRHCHPTMVGLGLKNWNKDYIGSNINNFDFRITKKIIDKFFTPKKEVFEVYNKMLSDKNLYGNDFVFVWARKTDKVEETSVPSAETYMEILKRYNLLDNRIFIQTDDSTMFDDFKKLKLNFEYFDEIPFAKEYSFHRLISRTSDDEFLLNYGITKDEYMIKMLCVLIFSVNSKKSIIYPGNPTTLSPIFKNTFNDYILFKDNQNLF
jgi:hypothetical protein